MSRPTEILLTGDKMKEVKRNFSILADLSNDGESLVLSKDLLFPGDKKKWEIFYDILMPEESYKYKKNDALFIFGKNGKAGINPKRATKEEAIQILDFLSDMKEEQAKEYLRKTATKQINAPQQIAVNKRKQLAANRMAKYFQSLKYRKGGKRKQNYTRRRNSI